MREIKFRFWRKDMKQMYNDIQFADFQGEIIVHKQYLNEGIAMAQQTYFDLMQFTGLYDKNGKEIYEGDVIKDNIGNRIVEIGFGHFSDPDGYYHEFYGVYGRWVGEEDSKSYFNKSDNDLEIIGNIYENPEFLETKEKE